jgi:hypothetical protein
MQNAYWLDDPNGIDCEYRITGNQHTFRYTNNKGAIIIRVIHSIQQAKFSNQSLRLVGKMYKTTDSTNFFKRSLGKLKMREKLRRFLESFGMKTTID